MSATGSDHWIFLDFRITFQVGTTVAPSQSPNFFNLKKQRCFWSYRFKWDSDQASFSSFSTLFKHWQTFLLPRVLRYYRKPPSNFEQTIPFLRIANRHVEKKKHKSSTQQGTRSFSSKGSNEICFLFRMGKISKVERVEFKGSRVVSRNLGIKADPFSQSFDHHCLPVPKHWFWTKLFQRICRGKTFKKTQKECRTSLDLRVQILWKKRRRWRGRDRATGCFEWGEDSGI